MESGSCRPSQKPDSNRNLHHHNHHQHNHHQHNHHKHNHHKHNHHKHNHHKHNHHHIEMMMKKRQVGREYLQAFADILFLPASSSSSFQCDDAEGAGPSTRSRVTVRRCPLEYRLIYSRGQKKLKNRIRLCTIAQAF